MKCKHSGPLDADECMDCLAARIEKLMGLIGMPRVVAHGSDGTIREFNPTPPDKLN
jgi:hypothetical protein